MKTNSKLRERLREATTEAILQAAEVVIAEEGLQTARVESIAQRAGTAVGTLYSYFKDRDALLLALVEARRRDLYRLLDETNVRVEGQPFEVQLEATLRTFVGHIEKHPAVFAILLQGGPAGVHRTGGGNASAYESSFELPGRIAKLTDFGVESGVLRPELRELYPGLLLGMVRGVLKRDLFDAHRGSLADRVPLLLSFFLQGGAVHRDNP